MSIKHVVLGVLAESPCHGYAVRAAIEERWGSTLEPGLGRIYDVLSRLEVEGLVERRDQRIGRRRRKVCAITPRGRAELRTWVQAPSAWPACAGVSARLLAAGADLEALRASLTAWERQERDILEHWVGRGRSSGHPRGGAVLGRRLAVEVEIARARTMLRVLARCREVLERYERGAPIDDVMNAFDGLRDGDASRPSRGRPG